MTLSITDNFFKFAVIAALGLCIYSIKSQQPSSNFDIESSIDLLLDSGYHLSESELALELLESRKILITTGINAQSSRRIIEKLHILTARDSSAPIDLYLRTEGGWEADAFSIIDTMQTIEPLVNVHAIGEVHSAGLMILTTATGRRIVYPNTLLGFHANHDDEDVLWKARYRELWESCAKLPDEWFDMDDGEMYYFSAKDALKYEVADQLVSSIKR